MFRFLAILINNTLYISGQLPIDPATGKFASDDIDGQTRQSLTNAKAILEAAYEVAKLPLNAKVEIEMIAAI